MLPLSTFTCSPLSSPLSHSPPNLACSHISRAVRKQALAEEYAAPQPPALDSMRRVNRDAVISRVPTQHSHGLTIVSYTKEKGVKDKKENALIPRGKSRNNYGGFFSS